MKWTPPIPSFLVLLAPSVGGDWGNSSTILVPEFIQKIMDACAEVKA
jgi:hypothetical protein